MLAAGGLIQFLELEEGLRLRRVSSSFQNYIDNFWCPQSMKITSTAMLRSIGEEGGILRRLVQRALRVEVTIEKLHPDDVRELYMLAGRAVTFGISGAMIDVEATQILINSGETRGGQDHNAPSVSEDHKHLKSFYLDTEGDELIFPISKEVEDVYVTPRTLLAQGTRFQLEGRRVHLLFPKDILYSSILEELIELFETPQLLSSVVSWRLTVRNQLNVFLTQILYLALCSRYHIANPSFFVDGVDVNSPPLQFEGYRVVLTIFLRNPKLPASLANDACLALFKAIPVQAH